MSRVKVEYTPLNLNTLSDEQLALIPKVGAIIIANNRNAYYHSNGLSNEQVERRGCYIVTGNQHPRFVILNEVRTMINGELVVKSTSMLKKDFYAKHIVWTEIKEPVWPVGKDSLSWEELAIERFAV